jgi:uncharacterized protein YfdQ (DUF2303 family)
MNRAIILLTKRIKELQEFKERCSNQISDPDCLEDWVPFITSDRDNAEDEVKELQSAINQLLKLNKNEVLQEM